MLNDTAFQSLLISSIEIFPSDVRLVPVDRLICPLAAHGGEIFGRMEL